MYSQMWSMCDFYLEVEPVRAGERLSRRDALAVHESAGSQLQVRQCNSSQSTWMRRLSWS